MLYLAFGKVLATGMTVNFHLACISLKHKLKGKLPPTLKAMVYNYPKKNLLLMLCVCLLVLAVSCKKEKNETPSPVFTVAPVQEGQVRLGFYAVDSAGVKALQMDVSKIGSKLLDLDLTFDTGSGGLVVDAAGLLPASMISSTGFVFSGDSTVVNDITITRQTALIQYGNDENTLSKVFGNLAYADVTIGDPNGNVTVRRLPFFIYYKAIDGLGKVYPAHEFDILGVSSEYDITFDNDVFITSPFMSFDPGHGLTRGFKVAALGAVNFSEQGTYVPAVTLGLTSADLTSSGFNMIPIEKVDDDGYVPMVPGTIRYNNQNFSSKMIFDTGTSPYFYIEDPNWPGRPGLLNANAHIQVATSTGFNYSYTVTSTNNRTVVENPLSVGGYASLMSLDFFLNNEYLLDFDNHRLGLKNN